MVVAANTTKIESLVKKCHSICSEQGGIAVLNQNSATCKCYINGRDKDKMNEDLMMKQANHYGLRLKVIKHPLKKKYLPKRDVSTRDISKRDVSKRDVSKSLLDKHEPAANSLLDSFVGASPPLIFPANPQFNRLRFGNISTILPPLVLPTPRSAIAPKIPDNVRIALEAASRRLNSLLSRVKEGVVDSRFLAFEVQGIRTTLRSIDGERARNAERAMEQIREREKLRRERFRQLTNRENISKLLPFGRSGPVVGLAAPNVTETSNATSNTNTTNVPQTTYNTHTASSMQLEERVGEPLKIIPNEQKPTTESTQIIVTVTPINFNASTDVTSMRLQNTTSIPNKSRTNSTNPMESGSSKSPSGIIERKTPSTFEIKNSRAYAKGRLSDIIKNHSSSAKNGSVIEDLRNPTIIVQPANTIDE